MAILQRICRLIWINSLLLSSSICCAQNGHFFIGAKSSAMSHANINSADQSALFNNPAGLGYQKTAGVMAAYQNRFNVAAFQTVGFGVSHPLGTVVPALSFYRFGDDIFNQQKLSIAIGSKIQTVSLGGAINFIQYNFSEIGTFSALSFEFGGIAELIEGVRIGAHIFNLNQAKFTDSQPLPIFMRFGLSYVPSRYLLITSEIEKELNHDETLKVGISYSFTDWVSIQSGFAFLPKSLSFGFGIHPISWSFHYAFVGMVPSGTIHEISIGKSFAQYARKK